ncbi:MAG: SHOCT domain-containing protein [Paludibacteraceae bacterium]|nr:SHOCT domain-containing protein [Paludibacteraceae bacterium]
MVAIVVFFSFVVIFLIIAAIISVRGNKEEKISAIISNEVLNLGLSLDPKYTFFKYNYASNKSFYSGYDSEKKILIFYHLVGEVIVDKKVFDNFTRSKVLLSEDSSIFSLKTSPFLIYIDDVLGKIKVVNICAKRGDFFSRNLIIGEFDFKDILSVEMEADYKSSSEKSTTSTVARAVVGGVVAGGVGALVGSSTTPIKQNEHCTYLGLRLTLCNITNPNFYIELFKDYEGVLDIKSSGVFTKVIEVYDLFNVIIAKNNADVGLVNNSEKENMDVSIVEELDRLIKLKQDGYITIEEFEALKKKLINV